MKRFVAILAAMMFAILALVPVMASADGAGYTMYVSSSNGKGVRMRQWCSTNSKVVLNLGEGRPVTVTAEDKQSGFSEVKVQVNGKWYNGYIMTKFLSKSNPANKKQAFKDVTVFTVKARTATATGKVSLWNKTDKKNEDKIRDLSKDDRLMVLQESRAWYKVMDMDGVTGYVAKAYVVAC